MQQNAFQIYLNHPSRQDIPVHRRVYDYLESSTMNFGYQGDTYTAEEALRKTSGNCLSLAILTTALAQLAGVETGYQLVDSVPIFESQGNVIFRGQHVRTRLYEPRHQDKEGRSLFSRGGLLIDYFARDGDRFVSNLSEAEYQAMYYNNLASEAISREDYNAAFWLLRKVMELTPQSASAINSMAVVYRRTGHVDRAEEIYKYGILHLPDKVSLLRNYRILLQEQGRHDEAGIINERLAELDESNPFDWLHAGQEAYDDGDFRDAISLYEKAVEIAPYLHESYAGMAKAHYMLGNRTSAKRELKKAQKLSYQKSIQSLYQAKLMALAGEY
jgi:Tfp pilus assembly protein PilF